MKPWAITFGDLIKISLVISFTQGVKIKALIYGYRLSLVFITYREKLPNLSVSLYNLFVGFFRSESKFAMRVLCRYLGWADKIKDLVLFLVAFLIDSHLRIWSISMRQKAWMGLSLHSNGSSWCLALLISAVNGALQWLKNFTIRGLIIWSCNRGGGRNFLYIMAPRFRKFGSLYLYIVDSIHGPGWFSSCSVNIFEEVWQFLHMFFV